MKKYVCDVCGWEYDEALGDPEHGIAPGTPFEELPEEEEFIPITKKDHVLQNVTVQAKKRYFTNDDWQYKNEAWGRRYATLHYDIDKELDAILDRGASEPTIFNFLRWKNALFDNSSPEYRALPYPGVQLDEN